MCFSSLQVLYLIYPIYSDCKDETHESIHGVCFPTVNKEHGISYIDSCVLTL